jgi:glucose/mannose transport system substrate-binding protein
MFSARKQVIAPLVHAVRHCFDSLQCRSWRMPAARGALLFGLAAGGVAGGVTSVAAQALPGTPAPAPAPSLVPVAAPSASLQVLHWWTSASERKAANLLATRLADEHIVWQDAAIPGGAGLGAGKVLKGRVLAGDAPEVTQMIGVSIAEWADLGLLLELDNVAAGGNWHRVLLPSIEALVTHRKHVMAVPLGIHRVNTLYYNRALFARL